MFYLYLTLIDEDSEKARFEEMYYRYRKLMHYLANQILMSNILAEEAVQEAFLRIAKNFSKVGEIESTATKNYVAIITKRVALNMAESEAKHSEKTISKQIFDSRIEAESGYLTTSPERVLNYKNLIEAISELPEKYREVLYLQGIYEYTAKETASLLNVSVDAVRKRTDRARIILREKIKEEEQSDEE